MSVVRGHESGVRGRKTEDRCQRTEGGGRKAEGRRRKAEDGGRRADVGSQGSRVRGQGSGVRGRAAKGGTIKKLRGKEAAGAGGEVGEGAAEGDVLGDGGLKRAVSSEKIRVPLQLIDFSSGFGVIPNCQAWEER